jgi:hypothetical protein
MVVLVRPSTGCVYRDIFNHQPPHVLKEKGNFLKETASRVVCPKAGIRGLRALRNNQQNNTTDYDGYRGYELWADVLVLKKYEAQ